jgi:dTDP-4-dehydrorhamnose 3,5-epimerase
MHLQFEDTPLPGLKRVQRTPLEDERGFFCRFYCAREFARAGSGQPVSQINHTLTRRAGAVRGLHFQYPPHAETKLVSCIVGAVFDVAVDLRLGSPTFLQWHGERLTAGNRASLLIPEGFAHGFQALEPNCELIYLHSAAHAPEAEGAINVSDPRLAIEWPLAIIDLSARDRSHPFMEADWPGIAL